MADLSLIWITTRAAGTAALIASSASVMLGLALAGRLPSGRGRLGDARVLHQTLGIATLTALAIHLITLALDPWLQASVVDLAVPFAMDYRTVWTGLGVIAAYGLLVLGLSGYLRRRIGRRWNVIHRFTAVAWAMSVAHTLGSGSDAGEPWMLAVVALCVVPVLVLAGLRMRAASHRSGAVRRPSPEPEPAATHGRRPAPARVPARPLPPRASAAPARPAAGSDRRAS